MKIKERLLDRCGIFKEVRKLVEEAYDQGFKDGEQSREEEITKKKCNHDFYRDTSDHGWTWYRCSKCGFKEKR